MAHPTLFTHPIKTLYYFFIVIAHFLKDAFKWILSRWYLVLAVLAVTVAPRYVPGQHDKFVDMADEIAYFMAYWILLGVASSIGLGTGLHTFVLYLGPHIAKLTLYSYECNDIPIMTPSKYNPQVFECPENPRGISFFQILYQVQFEAFLWGLGTALGELPPYFVARAAALANKRNEEIEEVQEAKKSHHLMDRAKLLIYNQLQRHAFITVLLCASIPNPLFDLAGITCGHFLIPFATFFSATAIGKAIIKVHIQMLFVIFVFTKEHVEQLVSFFEGNLPFLHKSLTTMLEKQRSLLKDPSHFKEGEKPLFAKLWDYFILAMIAYFLVSIINSLVAQYLDNHKEENKSPENKSPQQNSKKNKRD